MAKRTMERDIPLPHYHMVSAVEGYLNAMSMMSDDEAVVSVKKDKRTDDFVITVEKLDE